MGSALANNKIVVICAASQSMQLSLDKEDLKSNFRISPNVHVVTYG